MSWLAARIRALGGARLIELFAAANLGFLAVDIYLAHSFNRFAHASEWIPLLFSIASPVFLVPGIARGDVRSGVAWWLGLGVGAASIAVGVAGLLLHLGSAFMIEQTLKNLVYTAPLAAPLAYTGIGLLLVLNRLEDHRFEMWGRWVIVLAAFGFAGNFALGLADHAQNGFFYVTEWIPVVAAAAALAFLLPAAIGRPSRAYLQICYAVLGLQVLVGVAGLALHLDASLAGPHPGLFDNLVYGPPVFAPLLFADLALLAAIGVRRLSLAAIGASPGGDEEE